MRAPFVRVDSQQVPPRSVRTRSGRIPTLGDLPELDSRSPRLALRQSVWDLEESLTRFPTGEIWVSHFQIRTIQKLAAREDAARLTEDEQARLVEILQIFDAAVKRNELRAIHRLTSFQVLHAALREYLSLEGHPAGRIEELPTPAPEASRRPQTFGRAPQE